MKTKKCKKCGETKPLSHFYDNNTIRDKKSVNCKECAKSYFRDRYKENKEDLYKKRVDYRKENSEKSKKSVIKSQKKHRQRVNNYMLKWKHTPRGRLNVLKNRLKQARTEKTTKKILEQIEEVKKEIMANTEIFYELKQQINSGNTDITLSFIDGIGRKTKYSPVILAIYKIDDTIIYYTESKTGDLKHAFSIQEKKFIEISLLENLEPFAEIIDYASF